MRIIECLPLTARLVHSRERTFKSLSVISLAEEEAEKGSDQRLRAAEWMNGCWHFHNGYDSTNYSDRDQPC